MYLQLYNQNTFDYCIKMVNFTISLPARIIISGQSGTGKSTLVSNLLLNRQRLMKTEFDRIIYCAKYKSSMPSALDTIAEFNEGLPSKELVRNDENHEIFIVLDDMISEVFSSEIINDLFLTGRNRRLSCCIITQTLFPKSSLARNIMLQATHLIVFRNIRDASSFSFLARQVMPNNSKFFTQIYLNTVQKPYQYIVLDFSLTCPELFRYRSNLFSDPIIYINDEELQKNGAERLLEKSEKISPYFIKF